MNGIVLTTSDSLIIGPIAKFLGWIMNGIYDGLLYISGGRIDNIALCIVLLTLLIYICLLPLTIKQQKFSKLNQAMQPEIKKIQEKYKGKTDQASRLAMSNETQAVYDKYGVSPSGSCIQLIIQMPILFALYRVFYNVPAYMSSVKDHFSDVVTAITSQPEHVSKLKELLETYPVSNIRIDFDKTGDTLNNFIIDFIYKLPNQGWTALSEKFSEISSVIDSTAAQVHKMNDLFGLNISDTPWNIIKTSWADKSYLFVILAILVPVLAYVTQFLNVKLTPQPANADPNDQMARQMKVMNLLMPLMSFFIAFSCPVGLGFYWIVGAVIRTIQMLIINHHFKSLDLDAIIEQNKEKAAKKREKRGIYENQIRDAAQMRTRSINSKANIQTSAEKELELEKARAAKAHAKEGSLASKANLVKDFNERNSNK